MASSCLTPDACKSWEKSGKSDFVKQCKKLADGNGLWDPGSQTVKHAVYDLCWCVLRGQLKQELALSALADISDHLKDLHSLLADILGIIDVETSTSDDKIQREKFITLVGASTGIISEAILKERLDQETLEAAGLIPSKLQFQAKFVKTKTRLYYKQQKFNLLREESEGYSKLATELNQEIAYNKLTYTQVLENIKSLIGCFDLDPNRVLDIILESFECHLEHESFYIPLLHAYVLDRQTLCHVLGFRFHFYEPSQGSDIPSSLYKIAALLLKHKLVSLDDLYPHLLPSDADIVSYHNKEVSDAKVYARKLNVLVLSDKKDDDKDKEDTMKIDLRANNQKIGLCEALLEIGSWENAKAILDRMPEYFAVSYSPIAKALCTFIHAAIEPLYHQNCGLSGYLRRRRSKYPKDKSGIETVKTFQQLHHKVFPMLSYLGPHASIDPVLLVKFMRMGKAFMIKRNDGGIAPEDDVAYYGFLNVLDDVLLPCQSLLRCNCCIAEELWNFLKHFPYELRYRLYGHWKNDAYAQHPVLIRRRADCLDRAKYIMKRLSTETIKPSGRQIGKLTHSNPGVVFEYILTQIQRYDNFIGPVVDSLKFLSSMTYDMLTYCIIEAVASPERERLKHDDTNISLWLQSLANFAGSVCKKYQVELGGLLQYITNQLKAGKSYDLLLLREIVQKMAGIEISEEITSDQLDAMNGGELLRQEGGYFAQVRNTKKSSTRLKDSVLEHDLAVSLCLLMAQQRDSVIFQEDSERHLKLVGKLYDQCQDTLVQFGTFLSMQLSTEEFVKRLPSIDVLISEYHVPADAAFFLARPFYVNAINTRFEELRKIDKSNKQTSSAMKTQRYIEAAEEAMSPALHLVRPLFPDKIWDDISPLFYMTFWTLSMYDLYVPTAAYEKQIVILQQQITHIEDNKDMQQSKKKKEKERCTNLIEKLKDEEKKQTDHVNRVLGRLKHDQDKWILSGSTKNETVTQLLQLCIFPRCCFTASDAIFCAKFIHILHDLKTPNFSTLICFDRIFCDITYSVTSCTENEAHRYGRFLCAALGTVMKWHSDIEIYEKDCANFPGFVTIFRKKMDHTAKAPVENLDYENYRHVCHKWHFRITKAMVACLESGNYIQIRNALIVLTKILSHYPRITQFGQALERRVDRLSKEEKDKRPDIYAIAMGYAGQLKSKRMTWVPEHSFHIKEEKKGEAKVSNGPVQKTEVKQSGSKENMAKKLDNDSKGKDGKENKEKKEKNVEKREKTAEKKEKKEAKEKKEKKSSDHGAKESSGSKTPREKSNETDRSSKDKNGSDDTKEKSGKDVHQGDGDKPDAVGVKENGKSEGKSKKSDKKTKEEKVAKLKVKREKQEMLDERRAEKEKGKHSLGKEYEKTDERANTSREERSSSSAMTSSSNLSSQRQSEDSFTKYVDERGKDDPKRRKIDVTPSSGKSPSTERERERERDWDRDRDWDRKERKRDHSLEKVEADLKRRRSEEMFSSRSKQNGDSETSSKPRSRSKERDWQSNKHQSPSSRSAKYETSPVSRNRNESPTRAESPLLRTNRHSPPVRSRHFSPPARLGKHSSPPPPRSVKYASPPPRVGSSKKDLGSSDESPVKKTKVKKEKTSSSKKSKK